MGSKSSTIQTPAIQTPAVETPAVSARASLASLGAVASRALRRESTRKAFAAGVNSVKLSVVKEACGKYATAAQIASQRINSANLRDIAAELLALAEYVDAYDSANHADKAGCNIKTCSGVVHTAESFVRTLGMVDSKSDMLASLAAD